MGERDRMTVWDQSIYGVVGSLHVLHVCVSTPSFPSPSSTSNCLQI